MRPRTIGLLVVGSFLLSAHAQAQTVTLVADLAPLAPLVGFVPTDAGRVDDDGDGIADTWLIRGGLHAQSDETQTTVFYPRFAIVRLNGGLCREHTFDPIAKANAHRQSLGLPPFKWSQSTVTLGRDGRRDIIHVQHGTAFVQLHFDRVLCH